VRGRGPGRPDHPQGSQLARTRLQRGEVQQAQVVPVLLIAGDALVVVDAVAAAVQDELAAEHLDRARVMRGVAVDEVDTAADQPVGEADLVRVHVIPQLDPQWMETTTTFQMVTAIQQPGHCLWRVRKPLSPQAPDE
jgi:hypothetical protein